MEDKLATAGADESAPHCTDEQLVVKVGKKRGYHETEDLNSSLSENNNKDLITKTTKQTIAASDHKERSTMESDSKASSSSHQENWLELTKAEMSKVREENERLKKYLGKMMKDYQALQIQFHEIIQQEEEKKKSRVTPDNYEKDVVEASDEHVFLSLGRFSSELKKDGNNAKIPSQGIMKEDEDEKTDNRSDLSLGLKCKSEASECDVNELNNLQNISPISSFEEAKENAADESKNQKPAVQNGEDEVAQQNPLKKTRVSVRVRCDTPTMNDGCQWRKYGQKISKGNPCPRAYYRCTVAPSCPVRKQVQRCPEDMSILVTTYEATHNHPLPLSATAMASTTSAAASMLLSASSSSNSAATRLNPSAVISTTPAELHGLNFYLSDHNNSNPNQLYFHNSSSLSPSPSHPTITLDLTNPIPNSSNRFSNSYSSIPKFIPSTLNFSSSTTEFTNSVPNWAYGYGSSTNSSSQQYNRSQIGGLTRLPVKMPQQESSIAAATKAITSDPSFQSALAAALSSIIGNGGGGGGGGGMLSGGVDNFSNKLKWGGENFPVVSSGYTQPAAAVKGNVACAASYFNKTTTGSNSGSMMISSLPFTSPKSPGGGDKKDHNS